MAELADALDLGSSEATRTGSIPASCTIIDELRQSHNTLYYECKIVAFCFETTICETKQVNNEQNVSQ